MGSFRAFALVGLALATGWLAGCDRTSSPSESHSTPVTGSSPLSSTTASTASSASPASAAMDPMAGVRPKEDDVAASGATGIGPQDASTAVGGLAGNQDKGGARTGGTPAPTGGDGASAPAASASR
jgi:hypothetical protein